jgi:nicotinamide-nucleotide amidase
MFPPRLLEQAGAVLDAARRSGVRIATAETCTAGLISACLTSVPGASEVFERGFVLYHASAKATGLGVDEAVSKTHGAVSGPVTRGLAEGALRASGAGVAVALTGYAGPGGGNARDPVGTVYVAVASHDHDTAVERHVFEGDRDAVRLAGVGAALDLLTRRLEGRA